MRYKEYHPNRILEKSIELFWTNGVNGCSINDIVEYTGVNRFSLYNEFENKNGILRVHKNRIFVCMVQNPVYYTSTSEIPKFNWDIINETHNYKYLFKDEANIFKDDEVLTLFTEDKPEDIYNHLWTEYIDKHGLNDKMVLWFDVFKRLQCRFCLSGLRCL